MRFKETRESVTLIVCPDISSRHLYMFEANYKPGQNVCERHSSEYFNPRGNIFRENVTRSALSGNTFVF